MHEGEIGKSRARALICWPVNQCSLEDLVNISWLSFAFSFFNSISLFIQFVTISTVKNKKKREKKQITHTMNTIQLLLSHATVWTSYTSAVEIFISLNPWECMSIRGRLETFGQMNLGCFFILKICIYYIFCWHLRKAYMLWVLRMHLIHVSPCGGKKKKRGWQCNIWFSTLLHSMFSLYASLAILPYVWFRNEKSHILWNCFMGCAKVWRRSHKCWCFFSFPPSVIAMVCQNFPITVCGINLSQQTVSLLAILQ